MQIDELRNQLIRYNNAYRAGKPLISDFTVCCSQSYKIESNSHIYVYFFYIIASCFSGSYVFYFTIRS